MAAREGPVPLVDLRHRDDPRPGTRLRRVPAADRARRASPSRGCANGCTPSPANLSPPSWVDDPDFDLDHHVRRIAMPEAGLDAPGARSRLAVRRRPARTHPPALAVPRRRGPARRQGRRHPEDAPHDHRRRAWRRAVAAVPRLRARRTRAAPAHADRGRSRRRHAGGDPIDSLKEFVAGGLRLPIGIVKQVRELLADPASIPDASSAAAKTFRGIVTQLSDTAGARSPLWTAAIAAAPHRARTRAVPEHQGRRQAARRHPQHRVPHRRRRRRVGVPHRAGRAGRVAAGLDGDLHPHRVVGRERVLARPAARPHRRDADRRTLPRDPRGHPDGPRVEQDRRPRHDRRPSRARCRRR